MNDQKENVKKLIGMLTVPDEKKQELLESLEQGGVSQDLMNQIKMGLVQMRQAIQKEFPEEAKAWADIQSEVKAQEAEALKELNKELAEVDEELKTADKQFGKELDELEMQSAKKQLE